MLEIEVSQKDVWPKFTASYVGDKCVTLKPIRFIEIKDQLIFHFESNPYMVTYYRTIVQNRSLLIKVMIAGQKL